MSVEMNPMVPIAEPLPDYQNLEPVDTGPYEMRRALRWAVVAAVAAVALSGCHSSSESNGTSNDTASGVYFYWAGGNQNATATGVSAEFTQTDPKLGPDDIHTLTEVAVSSSDGRNSIEFGIWKTNGMKKSEMFTVDTVNGMHECLDGVHGCSVNDTNYHELHQVSHEFTPGETSLAVGKLGKFAIEHQGNKWELYYNDKEVGYYSDSSWGGKFTQAQREVVYGEVNSFNKVPCSEMGTGKFANQTGAAEITNFRLHGSNVASELQPFTQGLDSVTHTTNPNASNYYTVRVMNGMGVTFGGPGSEHC